LTPTQGWRVEIDPRLSRIPGVDCVLLSIDSDYPLSEMRAFMPSIGDVSWPHVEFDRLLCLPPARFGASIEENVSAIYADVLELIGWSDEQVRDEFAREMRTYWGWRVADNAPVILSLLSPSPMSREIAYCDRPGMIIVGETANAVEKWLRNSVYDEKGAVYRRTVVIWLEKPLVPDEYPRTGADILKFPGAADLLRPSLECGRDLPIVFGTQTAAGPVLVGVSVPLPRHSTLKRMARVGHQSASGNASLAFASTRPKFCRLHRVDAAWIFGRDKNAEALLLQGKKIAVVGCGSLGCAIANDLVRAGVGSVVLVDPDSMESHNVSRHLLGIQYIGLKKVSGLSVYFRRMLPLLNVIGIPRKVESLGSADLRALEACDMVVLAGVSLRGETFMDTWRRASDDPAPLICAWLEEYGLAGHSVGLIGSHALSEGYDENGIPTFALTDWPNGAVLPEAGCGNEYQPHGAVDVGPTANMASRHALDVLLGVTTSSERREWLGDRARVESLGGKARVAFDASNVFRKNSWPPR
jgi:hypothetical protein